MSTTESLAFPTSAPATAALDALFSAFNRSDKPGVIAGVSHKGQVIYRRGFGLASVEHGVANSPVTRSRIGSTSKQFACLGILLLAEEGKVDVDASVRTFFPELPVLQGEATLRQLMSHTSGYRCFLSTGFIANGMAIRPAGTVIPMQARQSDVNFVPGERVMYNNSGCHLLSLIIQKVSGLPFAQFLKDRIFDVVGMVDTASIPNDLEIHPGVATLHLTQPNGHLMRGLFPMEDVLGEGAIVSTIDDMLRWMAHMRGPKKVGTEATWAQLKTVAKLNNGFDTNYGLGLFRHDYRGVEVIHHPGGVIGGYSQMLTVPSHELDIIVMANWDAVHCINLAFGALEAVLQESLTAQTGQAESKDFAPLIGRRYFSPSRDGYEFSFQDVGGKLGLSTLNCPAVPLQAVDNRFWLDALDNRSGGPFEFELTPQLESAPAKLAMSDGRNAHTFELLPAPAPDTLDAGNKLVGHYRAGDLNAEAEILLDGDRLLLKFYGEFGMSTMDLEAFSSELFGWKPRGGVPESGTLHVQQARGKVTSLLLDSFRTRHVLLERLAD